MPLSLYFRPSFKRSLKGLGREQKIIVGLILESLENYYRSGCDLIEAHKVAPRFFYKYLRRPYFESGVEGNIRVVLRIEDNKAIAVLAGNHDQIKQFLKRI